MSYTLTMHLTEVKAFAGLVSEAVDRAGTLASILDGAMLKNLADHEEIRDIESALYVQFPDECHRRIDEQRGYAEAFVDALTKFQEACLYQVAPISTNLIPAYNAGHLPGLPRSFQFANR
jgi:hypothetical protein